MPSSQIIGSQKKLKSNVSWPRGDVSGPHKWALQYDWMTYLLGLHGTPWIVHFVKASVYSTCRYPWTGTCWGPTVPTKAMTILWQNHKHKDKYTDTQSIIYIYKKSSPPTLQELLQGLLFSSYRVLRGQRWFCQTSLSN